MFAAVVIGAFIVLIFAVEIFRESWRQNAWRRRWRSRNKAGGAGDDGAS